MPKNSKLKTQNSKLPIIVGPTGVGKSEVAFHLARKLGAEIISADAFQIYAGMEVGTAQPSPEYQKKVIHHLVGVKAPSEPWNAVEFAKLARTILDEGWARGKKFLLVGGAGFYLKTLIEGEPPGAAPTREIREEVSRMVAELGVAQAHALLMKKDPVAGKRIHVNDLSRIRRALEKSFSKKPGPTKIRRSFKPLGNKNVMFLGLERSREKLDQLLKVRTHSMWEKGLLDETKHLLESGLPAEGPLWGAIGYAEATQFLRGEMKREEALERIFRRTRQYAKRQWTWFKHQHEVKWVNLDEFSDILGLVDFLEKKIRN